MLRGLPWAWLCTVDPLHHGSDVLRSRSAAASNEIDPALVDEGLQMVREDFRGLFILPIGIWQASIWID